MYLRMFRKRGTIVCPRNPGMPKSGASFEVMFIYGPMSGAGLAVGRSPRRLFAKIVLGIFHTGQFIQEIL